MIKRPLGYVKTRYRGLTKNMAHVGHLVWFVEFMDVTDQVARGVGASASGIKKWHGTGTRTARVTVV